MQAYLGMYANPLMGFAGAMLSVVMVYSLSRRRFFNPTNMVLFGIVANLVFSSLVFFLFSIGSDEIQITLMWIMGDLLTLDVSSCLSTFPCFFCPFLLFFFRKGWMCFRWERKALYLGVNHTDIQVALPLDVALTAFACRRQESSGSWGIVPHLLRNVAGRSHLSSSLFVPRRRFLSHHIGRLFPLPFVPVELPVGS
jgi:ABC-type Fe3+-siderophore transport system permease subunit